MNALRVGNDYWINADDIVIVQPWPSRKATRERERAESGQGFYDATVRQPIRSLVTLQSGWVVASPLHPRALVRRRVVVAATVSTPPKEPKQTRRDTAQPPTEDAETPTNESFALNGDDTESEEAEYIEDLTSTRSSRRWPFKRR